MRGGCGVVEIRECGEVTELINKVCDGDGHNSIPKLQVDEHIHRPSYMPMGS
jgi:hypothetical protein